MFIIGTGMLYWPGVPFNSAIWAYKGIPLNCAAALAAASDTARIALAPKFSLFSVPSSSIMAASRAA